MARKTSSEVKLQWFLRCARVPYHWGIRQSLGHDRAALTNEYETSTFDFRSFGITTRATAGRLSSPAL